MSGDEFQQIPIVVGSKPAYSRMGGTSLANADCSQLRMIGDNYQITRTSDTRSAETSYSDLARHSSCESRVVALHLYGALLRGTGAPNSHCSTEMMTWPHTIHRTLRPPRGNRRLGFEVDDSAVATVAPNGITVGVVTAHASMVNVEAAAEKSVFKSKVHKWRRVAVNLLTGPTTLPKAIFIIHILIGIFAYSLCTRAAMIFDYYTEQGDMAIAGAIWAGMFMLFMLTMRYLVK
ncbi:uncharacterized protein EAF01_002961 [Botrytis porri]|uniref:uncharacterized protein n=1 Tax=Botrytis porri TaxID=87229 RepID=UPI0019024D90|nr:uncharacterized protein EAF01_002961 [Botrytis porri]KAF7911454.1 hypothetical protein EAF01_002961 [Botrytis porri]